MGLFWYEPDRFLFVHLPPHLGPDITSAVAQGDAVRVRGVRPRGADMVAAVAVISSDGGLILDNGPDGKKPQPRHEKAQKIEVEGVVRMSLFGPKGELRGAQRTKPPLPALRHPIGELLDRRSRPKVME
jgi:hypothetical protein